MRRSTGFTMVELVVAIFLVALILSAIAALFINERQNFERPRSAMTSEEDLLRVVRVLKQDLEETDVQSIKSFPSGAETDPGLSLESPRTINPGDARLGPVGGTLSDLDIGPFGVANWHKYVYYHLVTEAPLSIGGKTVQTHSLERYEGALSDAEVAPAGDGQQKIPVPSSVQPSVGPATRFNERILAQTVVLPGETVNTQTTSKGVGQAILPPPTAGDYVAASGGFHVFWKDPATGSVNNFEDATAGSNPLRGDPVFVELYLLSTSDRTGKNTLTHYELQVHPRN